MLKKLLFVGLLVLVAMMMVGCDEGSEVNMSNVEQWVKEDLEKVELPDIVIEVQIEMPDVTPNEAAGTIGDFIGIGDALDAAVDYSNPDTWGD